MEPQVRPVATFDTVSRAAWRVCRANLTSIVVVTLAVTIPIDTVGELTPLPDDAGLKEWARFFRIQLTLDFWIGTIASLAITHVAVADHRGTRLTVREAFQRALRSYWNALWATFLYNLAFLVGLLLLVLPGLLIGVGWFFAFPIIVAHNKSGWQALRQSERFVMGRWRTFFGRIASIMLLLLLGVLTLSIPTAFLPENVVLGVLVMVPVNLLLAYATVWFTMLYLLSEPEPVATEADPGIAATC